MWVLLAPFLALSPSEFGMFHMAAGAATRAAASALAVT